MTANNKHIALCIYCLTRYRVPIEYEGKRVFCKNCGGYFNLLFEENPDAKDSGFGNGDKSKETHEISRKDSRLLLGNLALRYDLLDESDMKQALYIQQEKRDAGETMLLGEILVANRMISRSQLNFLLSVQKMLENNQLDLKFGEIAVENRFVSEADIQRALQEQKQMFKENKSVKLLGDILLGSGMISLEQRDAILMKQDRMKGIEAQN
jgi:hypothetical protein